MLIQENNGIKRFIMVWLHLSPWHGTLTRVKTRRWRLKPFREWRHKLKIQDGAQTYFRTYFRCYVFLETDSVVVIFLSDDEIVFNLLWNWTLHSIFITLEFRAFWRYFYVVLENSFLLVKNIFMIVAQYTGNKASVSASAGYNIIFH